MTLFPIATAKSKKKKKRAIKKLHAPGDISVDLWRKCINSDRIVLGKAHHSEKKPTILSLTSFWLCGKKKTSHYILKWKPKFNSHVSDCWYKIFCSSFINIRFLSNFSELKSPSESGTAELSTIFSKKNTICETRGTLPDVVKKKVQVQVHLFFLSFNAVMVHINYVVCINYSCNNCTKTSAQ